jgi:hypothetical protein
MGTAESGIALRRNPKVAITIDTNAFPCKVLLVRGTATLKTETEPIPEWVAAGKRMMGEELGTQVSQQLGALVPRVGGMVCIRVRPEWVGIIDFQTRLPTAAYHQLLQNRFATWREATGLAAA